MMYGEKNIDNMYKNELLWITILLSMYSSIFYNFLLLSEQISVDNVRNGRLHTLITSAFSHKDMEHIISNMIGLYFFGTNVWMSFLRFLLSYDSWPFLSYTFIFLYVC